MSITPRQLWVGSVLAWSAGVALGMFAGAPLGHDEAAYALLARDGQSIWLYRPIGIVTVGKLGIALGGSDLAMRAGSAVLSLSLLVAAGALGRRFGPWVGAWTAALIAGSQVFVVRGFQLLNDVPSAACLLAVVVIAIDELDDDGPSYRLVWIAPLAGGAFYLRYGSAPVIGIIGITAVVVWWRSVRTRPGPVLVSVALFGALVLPFLVYSARTTGSPFGILAVARAVATYPVGHGLSRFMLSNPFVFYGGLAPLVMLAGIIGAVRPAASHARRALFLALVAAGQVIALGLVSAGDTRFIFFAIVLMLVLGVDGVERAMRARPTHARLARRLAAGLVVASWIATIAIAIPVQRHIARGLAGMVEASAAIRSDAAGRACVVAAYEVPQLMWYTRCEGVRLWARRGGLDLAAPLPPGRRWYVASSPRYAVAAEHIATLAGPGVVAEPLGAPGAWRLIPP